MLFAAFAAACSSELVDTADTGEVDPDCVDAQLVTYNNFGEGFIKHSCQGCHSSEAANRYGAPEDASFDDLDAVGIKLLSWRWRQDLCL